MKASPCSPSPLPSQPVPNWLPPAPDGQRPSPVLSPLGMLLSRRSSARSFLTLRAFPWSIPLSGDAR